MQKKGKSSASKKSAPKKRKARKVKVALDRKKLMALCAVVCASCVLLLAVTAFFSRGTSAPKSARTPDLEKVVPEKDISKKEAPSKNKKQKKTKEKPASKTETPAPTPPSKKEEPARKSESDKAPATVAVPAPEKNAPAPEPVAPTPAPQQQAGGFDFPLAQNGAVLCVVFDDGGQNVSQLKKCVALPFPVTVAVLPRLAHSAESAQIVRQSKNEVILHQPMQAVNLKVNPGAGAIKPDMTAAEVAATLSQNIAEISPIAGMNNHEGSLITEDEVLVSLILEVAREKGIYFLDSRTSSATKIPSAAMELGMGWYQRDIFLDNKKTRENYLAELKKGLDIANKKGHVIMIGHVWSAESLPAFLEEAYPELALKGYRFSTVSKSGGMMR